VLEAAHIKPYKEGGEHRVDNGLLLRSDLHTLFDRGYITITTDYHVEISRRIREDFENGKDYYALARKILREPASGMPRPSRRNLTWHNDNRYLG
jgi:putative restriction endonuclease